MTAQIYFLEEKKRTELPISRVPAVLLPDVV